MVIHRVPFVRSPGIVLSLFRNGVGAVSALAIVLATSSGCTRLIDPYEDKDDDADDDTATSEGGGDDDTDPGATSDSQGTDDEVGGDGSDTGSTADDVGTDSGSTGSDGEDTGTGDTDDETGDDATGDSGSDTTGDGDSETGDSGSDEGTGDDGTGDTDTGTGTGDTDEPPGPCPAQTHECIAVPPNWEGPIAVGERDWSQAVPSCTGEYSEEHDRLLFANLSAPAAECTCDCGDEALPPLCAITLERRAYCTGTVEASWTVPEGECVAVDPIGYGQQFSLTPTVAEPGQCTRTVDVAVEPPAWGSKAALCSFTGTPLEATCGTTDETCVPRPTAALGGRVCIRRAGEHACPAPFVTTKEWFLDEASAIPDNRGCSECTCTWSGGVCGGRLSMDINAQCAGDEAYDWPNEGCHEWEFSSTLQGASLEDAVEDPGACASAGGQPEGEATAQQAATVCCL